MIIFGQYRPIPGVKNAHEINLKAKWEKAPEREITG
jgi:hypothetical protein